MKKRLAVLLLALVMVLGTLPFANAEEEDPGAAYAESGGEGQDATAAEDEDPDVTAAEDGGINAAAEENKDFVIEGGVLKSYKGPGGEVVIPDSVTSIKNSAFQGCAGLTSVTIPNSVISIGNSAFKGCTGLTGVTISASVTSIQDYTFEGCKNLTSVTIPGKVTSIGNSAFASCEKLTSVTIPNSVTSIGMHAFASCWRLTGVTIPYGVTSIGTGAFGNCEKLTGVTIPDSVTSIGTGAFSGCKGMTSLTISGGITSIESQTFTDCRSLTSVTIPYGVTSIGSCAFSSCKRLTSVTIPNSVTSIGDAAFIYCETLADAVIPDSVTSLGKEVFWDCKSLNSVTIPNGVTSIGDSTFGGCESLTSVTIPDSVTSIGKRAFENCVKLTSLTIPGKVTSIGSNAFLRCEGLTGLTIPASVTSIGSDAFNGCTSLKEFTVESGSQTYATADGVLFDIAQTTLVAFPGGKEGAYTIPDGVTSIGDSAFEGCVKLTGLTIPAGVTSIGSGAFRDCEGLTSVTIPVSVTSMETSAFTRCTNLAEIYYGGSEAQWQSLCRNPSSLKGAVIHYGSAGPQDRKCPDEMTYSFGNNAGVFGYGESYKIPYARYVTIYGNTPRASELYSNAANWGGSCFGMSTTSALFFQTGNQVSVKDFDSTAANPADLAVGGQNAAWNLTLRDFIETMQVSWNDNRIYSNYISNQNDLNALCGAVRSFRETGSNPPVVTVYGTSVNEKNEYVQGGHAMLAYDLEETGGGYHLKVYDPNYPNNDSRFITLNPSDGSWSYSMNDTYNWSNTDSRGLISFIPYSGFYAAWSGRTNAKNRAAAEVTNQSALLFLSSDNAEIYDANGTKVAWIQEGTFHTSRPQDICQLVPIDASETGASAGTTALYLPPDLYTVKNTGASAKAFEATMVHVDQSASVTTSGSSVTFAVNDRTEVNYARVNDAASDPNTAYTVTMKTTPADGGEELDTLTVSGQLGQDDPSIAQVSGELYGENLDGAEILDGGTEVQAKDGSSLDISKIAGASGTITATLQKNGSVTLSEAPAGVQTVYAASYDSSGRMTGVAAGTLRGSTLTFQGNVARGSQIFLLSKDRTPVCGRITIR